MITLIFNANCDRRASCLGDQNTLGDTLERTWIPCWVLVISTTDSLHPCMFAKCLLLCRRQSTCFSLLFQWLCRCTWFNTSSHTLFPEHLDFEKSLRNGRSLMFFSFLRWKQSVCFSFSNTNCLTKTAWTYRENSRMKLFIFSCAGKQEEVLCENTSAIKGRRTIEYTSILVMKTKNITLQWLLFCFRKRRVKGNKRTFSDPQIKMEETSRRTISLYKECSLSICVAETSLLSNVKKVKVNERRWINC